MMQEELNIVRRNIKMSNFNTIDNLNDVLDKSITNILSKKLFDEQREFINDSKCCKFIMMIKLLKDNKQSDHCIIINFLHH